LARRHQFPICTRPVLSNGTTTDIPMTLKKLLSSFVVATAGPLGGSGESTQRMFGGQ